MHLSYLNHLERGHRAGSPWWEPEESCRIRADLSPEDLVGRRVVLFVGFMDFVCLFAQFGSCGSFITSSLPLY